MRRIACSILVCLSAPAGEARAAPEMRDAPPAEARTIPYSGVLPACEDRFVLAEISRDFLDRESEFWSSGLAIAAWLRVHEVGYRESGDAYVPARHCSALADFNDGLRRRVGYRLAEDLGFAGVGWGVEWCVAGLDRNHAYGAGCRAMRP